jgi:hypothetical protein
MTYGETSWDELTVLAKLEIKWKLQQGLHTSAVNEFTQTTTVNVLMHKCLDVRDCDRESHHEHRNPFSV